MSDLGVLFAGFAAAWAITFGYLWYLAQRTKDLQRRLGNVEARINPSP